MAETAGSFIVGPRDGETIRNPVTGSLTFKARGKETGGAVTAFETRAAPGEGPPLHLHSNEDEVLLVLEGTLRIKLEDEIHAAVAGAFAFFSRGEAHTWQNVGDAPARILVIFTPAGIERFFERFAEVPDDASAPDAFRTIGSAVGMHVVGPPLAQSDPF